MKKERNVRSRITGQSAGCSLYKTITTILGKLICNKKVHTTQCENSANFPWNNIQSNGAIMTIAKLAVRWWYFRYALPL